MADVGRTMIGPHERGSGATAWLFRAVAFALFVGTLTTLYPLVWLVGNAFKSPEEYGQTPLRIAPSLLAPDVTKSAANEGAGRLNARVVSREAVRDHSYAVSVMDGGFIEIASDDERLWSMEREGDTEIVIDGVSFGLMGQLMPGDRFEVVMRRWQTGNYAEAWESVRFVRHSINTFVLMAAIWALHILINSLAAYALSRLPFPGSKLVMFGFLMTLMVPWYAIFIPLYLTVTDLQLTRPLWGWPAVILPAGFNAFFLILFKSFFDGLPGALIDASRIDGATARMPRNTPTQFTSITVLNSSSDVSRMRLERKMPALFTSTSMRPSRVRISSIRFDHSDSLRTSRCR